MYKDKLRNPKIIYIVLISSLIATFAYLAIKNSWVGQFYTYSHQQNDEGQSSYVEDDVQQVEGNFLTGLDYTSSSIDIGKIQNSGVGVDGIPAIVRPKYVTPDDIRNSVDDRTYGIGVYIDGEAKFYPYSILVWHEIVNAVVGGKPVIVTFCPLCGTGAVYDRRVGDKTFVFGVSGKLWQSNMLMYNRESDPEDESLWSQILGEALVGKYVGTKLELLPSQTTTLSQWRKAYPDTLVLYTDTGFNRDYNRDPYGDPSGDEDSPHNYYCNRDVYFPVDHTDDRFPPKTQIVGIDIPGFIPVALVMGDAKDGVEYKVELTPVEASKDKLTLSVFFDELHMLHVRKRDSDEEIPFIGGFWFSWVAVHPDTEVVKVE